MDASIPARMLTAAHLVDDVLRDRWRTLERAETLSEARRLLLVIVSCAVAYGAVMGSSGGVLGDRFWQVLYAAAKTPILLIATFAISLPSFFVANTLVGLRHDFADSVRALLRGQAVVVLVLASLAPYVAVWYLTSADYIVAVAVNGVAFFVSSLVGQTALRRNYQRLIARNPRHRVMFWTWLAIYVFVGIQMAWTLRPFIGTPTGPVEFLRGDFEGNAYLRVIEVVRSAFLDI